MPRFLLVFLTIETILQEPTIYQRKQKLRAMEDGLDLGGAYETMLRRIEAQGGKKAKLGMAALMWISHSRRPLQVNEICQAVAIRTGSNDLDTDDILTISTLLDCCQGLITVDKGASIVRLIHFTLQEHLCTHPDLFDRAHSTMAETCLTYLNFQHIKDIPAGPSSDPQDTPFLEYSSLYWGTHMRMEHSDGAKELALQLLCQFESHISAQYLLKPILIELGFGYYPGDEPFSPLHCISYFGISEITNTLIKMNRWDVNQRDGLGMTPLIWAARFEREEVVKLLLQNKNIPPDQRDARDGRTALSWASGNGHEGVVRLFLGSQFVNPGSVGRRWGKAARVVDLLSGGRYVNPDSSCESDRTPLSWAAENGHERIVKLLLGRKDVNPDSSSQSTRTPLSWAARNGHEGIVKLLLGKEDVNPNTLDTLYSQTPLSCAAAGGHEGIVKLLLGRKDVNPDSSGDSGITPLAWAATGGHEGIVKLLLGRKDVNPGSSSESGLSPLLLAAKNGHEGTVKLLLGGKDFNSDTPVTAYGRTPLSWAAENGHQGIVQLLLEQKDANPNGSNESGLSPLLLAARNGQQATVKLLLQRKDVNPNIPDTKYGRTPLSWAAGNGHEGIVKLLLQREDVNPDGPSQPSGTPLSWAAAKGHEGIVKLLLEREDVNPDIPDTEYGHTPLSLAAQNGHEGVVKILLGREDVNPNSSSKSGESPLTLAAKNRHEKVVELLQARNS